MIFLSFSLIKENEKENVGVRPLVSTLAILPPRTEQKKRKDLAVDPKEETNESRSSICWQMKMKVDCQQIMKA